LAFFQSRISWTTFVNFVRFLPMKMVSTHENGFYPWKWFLPMKMVSTHENGFYPRKWFLPMKMVYTLEISFFPWKLFLRPNESKLSFFFIFFKNQHWWANYETILDRCDDS
jgi:hypothetical protein